jgi:signal transduction histidine kinase
VLCSSSWSRASGTSDLLLRSQEAFVADASHQLRTPLTALRLRLENLGRDVTPSGQDELAGALAEVERLAGLVDALLALARADAGGGPTERVDVRELLKERVEAWAAFAQENGVRLAAELNDVPAAAATPERLRQAIDNLIENAIVASPEDGTIMLSLRGAAGWIEAHVRDEGPGLSPEDRPRAFDRFWRGRDGEGSGLGLAIARRLVEADGGTIELVPAPSHGLDAVVRVRPA